MKSRSLFWIMLGLALAGAAFVAWQPARAADSSCVTCHETQAKNPVRQQGQWHIQHAMLDCVVCHGGSPAAQVQEEAHAGQIVHPLQEGTSCAMCHPDNTQEGIAAYQALITPEAPEAPVEATAPADAVLTTTAPGACRVVATECVAAPVGTPGAAAAPEGSAEPAAPADTGEPAAGTAAAAPAATDAATEPAGPASTPAPTGAAAAASSGGAPAAPPAGGLTWMEALQFARGPLFKAAFWFCVLGLLLRVVQALRAGWKHQAAADKVGRAAGLGRAFLSGLLVLPFIPGVKGAFRRKPVIYAAGGLFHLGLFSVVLFSKTHMTALKSMLGFGWPALPPAVIPWLSAIGIVAMLALLINRLADPVLRLISGPSEWLNWLLVFLPMLTGFVLARKLLLAYEVSFTIHMLLVDLLLVWIPLSRISHFVFYFFSRAIHGVEFQTRRVAAS
ncbi:MAG: hypothetical protein ACKOC5_18555 [Chloroflexota bacterium]